MDGGIQCDQRRRAVPNGRAVGNIPANGGGVAHLHGAVPANEFCERRMVRRNCRLQIRQRRGCPDPNVVVGDCDPSQFRDPVEKGDRAQIAEILCDPQTHIRSAGDKRAIRVFVQPCGQSVSRCRELVLDRDISARTAWGVVHMVRHGRVCCVLRGANDRRVACAAAQISRKFSVIVVGAVQMRRGHCRDEAGGAKAALRSVMIHHCLLYRVKRAVRRCDPFDRAHSLAVQLRHEQDTGVERARAVLVGHHHGTGPAIAFVAAFLGAREALFLAQPVEQRGGVRSVGGDLASVQKKGRAHVVCPPPYQAMDQGAPSMRRRGCAPLIKSRTL